MGVWSSVWRTEASDWTHLYFPLLGEGGVPVAAVEPNGAYISIFLERMRIANTRVGYARFHGALQSYVRLLHVGEGSSEFQRLVLPQHLKNVESKDLENFVIGRTRLAGPAPYVGGDIDLEVGLFAIKSEDLLDPILELVENLTSLAGVSVFDLVKPYVAPIKKGISTLLDGKCESSLQIGISTTLSKILPGRYAVARTSSILGTSLSLDSESFLLKMDGERVVEFPYFVFSVLAEPIRTDWTNIPAVSTAYLQLREAVRDGKSFKDIEARRQHFNRVVLTCVDLIDTHTNQIVAQVESWCKHALANTTTSRRDGGFALLPDLSAVELNPPSS